MLLQTVNSDFPTDARNRNCNRNLCTSGRVYWSLRSLKASGPSILMGLQCFVPPLCIL
jgi:hypothetical protein